jgi:hypothetical protein
MAVISLIVPRSFLGDTAEDKVCTGVVQLLKMRRILSFVVALGLTGLGSLPVSACALAHSRPSDCVTPQTKTDCERMAMGQPEEPGAKVSAGSKTCCVVSEAPAPEARTWAGSLSVAAALALVSSIFVPALPFEISWSRVVNVVNKGSSPPALQSVLCTFLI